MFRTIRRLLKRKPQKPFPYFHKTFYVSCALEHPDREPIIRKIIAQLVKWAVVGDSVIVVGPPMHRIKEPNKVPLFVDLCRAVKAAGLKLYVGTRFWDDSVGEHNEPMRDADNKVKFFYPTVEDCWNVDMHIAKIVHVKKLARVLGADGTFFDAESYALDEIPYNTVLRPGRIMTEEQEGILRKIDFSLAYAVEKVGQVDMAYPVQWRYEPAYAWSTARLGKLKLGHITYTNKTAELAPILVRNPFEGWGCWISTGAAVGAWNPYEWLRSFPAEQIREKHPSVVVIWFYAADKPNNDIANCMSMLGDSWTEVVEGR